MTKTALIVEDEIFVALDLERILLDAGYAVAAIAADSASALEAAPGCGFAFVDVNLRDGATGPGIAERMARDYGVKVVFVTANPAQIDCGSDCALGYIRKPFSEAAILAAAAMASDSGSMPANDDIVMLGSTGTGLTA
ncbi:response regulator [Sphingomonas sp. RP10(2022)]|uniref:Response regulator n=1 Tax=Sphingomonas liriopis TaxID=2949094 RepID=A0A9X2HPP3_9SPHN|nr:response regulator [Sphingomonas liriopis]MCP3734102.1 response regulator [Sphingomonas liriopis]